MPVSTGARGMLERMRRTSAALSPVLVLFAALGAVPPAEPTVPERGAVDTSLLPALLAERGFAEPDGGFLAYVIAMRFEDGRSRLVAEKRFDVDGTSAESSDWNPASTVKLYAAIGALLRIRELGFDRGATLTFHGTADPQTSTLTELVEQAVGPSVNLAYDYLAAFTGFDRLHDGLFVDRYDLGSTALRVPYDKHRWQALGFSEWLRDSPAITVTEGERVLEVEAQVGHAQVACHQGACTSPAALGETLRRVMLQEVLPAEQGFGLAADDLQFLRTLLASERPRGMEVVEHLRPSFSGNTVFSHKAGFAEDWFSDNVYIDDPELDRTWVVVLAGNPGRSCLDDAATIVGELLAQGKLDP
jgi:hypothetical protein